MRSKLKIVFIVSPLVLLLDQLTKWWIVVNVPMGTRFPVISGFFDIVHARNRGAAFGFLHDWASPMRDVFFYIISTVAVVFLYYFLKQVPPNKKIHSIPLALIFGGALGNITDRIFRGSVVDFLSVHIGDKTANINLGFWKNSIDLVWPAFNVADSAISVGIVWLLFVMNMIQSSKKD